MTCPYCDRPDRLDDLMDTSANASVKAFSGTVFCFFSVCHSASGNDPEVNRDALEENGGSYETSTNELRDIHTERATTLIEALGRERYKGLSALAQPLEEAIAESSEININYLATRLQYDLHDLMASESIDAIVCIQLLKLFVTKVQLADRMRYRPLPN